MTYGVGFCLAVCACALAGCPRSAPRVSEISPHPAPSASAATWSTSAVDLTWIVDDVTTPGDEPRSHRALAVRVGGDVRRYDFGPTKAGCGLFPDRPVVTNPVAVGAEVSRLRCWLGGGDDLVVTRAARDTLWVTNETSSDGYGAPPPVAVSVTPPIPIPNDAFFGDHVLFLDHGKHTPAAP
jgi:hypothetical protein